MMTDADLDRYLAGWLGDGAERAPRDDVYAALRRVATTPQRGRVTEGVRSRLAWPIKGRWLAAAATALVALTFTVGFGSGAIQMRSTVPPEPALTPAPSVEPVASPSAVATPADPSEGPAVIQVPDVFPADLVEWSPTEHYSTVSTTFVMPIPRMWAKDVESGPPSPAGNNLYVFDNGRVVVSLGDREGTIGWWTCRSYRELIAQRTIADLEASVREGCPTLGTSTATTLDGHPARWMPTSDDGLVVVSIHEGRPILIQIDPGTWTVSPSASEAMLAGFEVVEPQPLPDAQDRLVAAGHATVRIPDAWTPSGTDATVSDSPGGSLMVRAGRRDGSIRTCDTPATLWEWCRNVAVDNLAELVAYIKQRPPPDPDLDALALIAYGTREDSVTLDGEPAVVLRMAGYQYPAKGGQAVAFVLAMHRGRPFIVRAWTEAGDVKYLSSLIAGFRFVDTEP